MCAVSLDHLVGAAEQWQWNREAERLRDFQIDGHLDFRGLLNRKVSGFFALKNAAGIKADSAISTSHIASVAHETARRNELAVAIDGWDSVLSRRATSRSRWLKKKFSPLTTSAPSRSVTMVAKTDSISLRVLASKITTRAPCRILYDGSFSCRLANVSRVEENGDRG